MNNAREPIGPKVHKKGRRVTVGERRMQLACMTIPELIADIRNQGVALAFGAVELCPDGTEVVHLVIDAPGKYLKWAVVERANWICENSGGVMREFRVDAFHELKKRCLCYLGAFVGHGGEIQLATSAGELHSYLRFHLKDLYEGKNVSCWDNGDEDDGSIDGKDDDDEIEPRDLFKSNH